MPTSPTLLTASTLALSFSLTTVAQAKDPIALSFDLDPSPQGEAQSPPPAVATVPDRATPLPIPPEAIHPPLGHTPSAPSAPSAYGGVDALALADQGEGDLATLPAPPQLTSTLPAVAALPPVETEPDITPMAIAEPIDIAIHFDLITEPKLQAQPAIDTTIGHAVDTALDLEPLFAGGADSLVARAVGSAEGTRTPEGQRTPAYFGHVDPGNAAWNLGSFSYQHGAASPEVADQKQLQRLQAQAQQLQAKAAAHDVELSTVALLNGIDLANQAPMAALDRWGYVERLAQAQQSGLTDEEAIIWARTRAFIDPDTQRWNAPGLGNTLDSISRDQTRRVQAIAQALAIQTEPPMVTAATPAASAVDPIDDILLSFPQGDPSPSGDPIASESPRQRQPQGHPEGRPTRPTATPLSGAVPTTQVLRPLSSKATDSADSEKRPSLSASPLPHPHQP